MPTSPHRFLLLAATLLLGSIAVPAARADSPSKVRFATFNASLNRGAEGALVTDLSQPGNAQADAVAEIIQRSRPDVVLVNEFDYVEGGRALQLFQDNYLSKAHGDAKPIRYGYRYSAPSNTGLPSGFDLDNANGVVTQPGTRGYGEDSFGFGAYPGQFGMAVYSRYPIVRRQVRTFQKFLWKDMPGALLPDDPATPADDDFYSPDELAAFRLSSKSHWDLPLRVNGETVHFLVSHPTPPVFDGPEDRNGARNYDEIRFWSDYVRPARSGYIYDDRGGEGGLEPRSRFVIAGDLNSDPSDGDSIPGAAQQLLENPRINASVTPTSPGAVEQSAAQGLANLDQKGPPAQDTADFDDRLPNGPGNLRVDYVLPSRYGLDPVDGFVFWPLSSDPRFAPVGTFPFPSSDHRLVALDVRLDRRD
ncbi:MAG: endonuclease/exonuclease/phosphatase family protein [Solirubrobacterales bacterium]|nr:endonuclease/exonuclease/phosphatase family protein [Solirubrobacterales bacterium]